MSYNERLNKLINESGLKIITIAQRCQQLGVDLKPSYISVLKNSPDKVASDKISKAIAIACNASDKDILIIENYIDNAPEALLNTFEIIKDIIISTAEMYMSNDFSDIERKAIKDNMTNMPIVDFISMLNRNEFKTKYKKINSSNSTQIITEDNEIKVISTLAEPQGFIVSDNTMQPTLLKGDKVNLEITEISKLNNNDIVCFTEKKNPKKLIYRMCYFMDNKRTVVNMIPLSNIGNAKAINYNMEKITILGKVTRIIRNI